MESLLGVFNNFFFRLCPADGGMPRDLDLRKLQAFGSDILDIQAQAPERVYVALNDCKIMVLDRLLVKHVLRCTQPILQSVSGVALHRQKLFLLPHESCVRCLARCSHPRVLLRSPVAFSVWDGDRLQRSATLHLEAGGSGRRGSSKPSALAVDPTGSFVAVGDCSGGVRVWDVSQTSGLILARNHQDCNRPPASISLISWFKAHVRRLSFVAFTSNSDVATVSSGASVRVWSVTGAAIGKVGRAFQSGVGRRDGGPMLKMEEQGEPEVSARGAVDDDDNADSVGAEVRSSGERGRQLRDGSDSDGGDVDADGGAAAPAFGHMASHAIALRRQRHGKLARR